MSNQSYRPERLRQDSVSVSSSHRPGKEVNPIPTLLPVFLCHQPTASETRCPWVPAAASLDSGTKYEWVSGQLLQRFNEVEYTPLKSPETYKDFQGVEFTALKGVKFTFYFNGSGNSRTRIFRVVENGPFDVVIGAILLFKERIFTFDERALLFFHSRAKDGEKKRMQQTLASQSAEVLQYSTEQSVANSNARQRQREALDASRHSGTGGNLTDHFRSPGSNIMAQQSQYGRSWSGPPSQAKPGHHQPDSDMRSFGQPETYGPAYSQPVIGGNAYTLPRTQATTTPIKTQSQQPGTVKPESGRRPTLASITSPRSSSAQGQILRPIGSGNRDGRWQCSHCKLENDPSENPERCGTCHWSRGDRA